MMKKQILLAMAGVALGVASLLTVVDSAAAQSAPFPLRARGINTWMARAMDKCSPAEVSVVGSNLPSSGCYQTNAATDSSTGMKYAKLRITNRGKIALYGTGFKLGDVVRVRLTLRVTRSGIQTMHPTSSSNTVTFQDITVDCPKAPDAFNARPTGVIAGSTSLSACLAPDTGLSAGNIEILDMSVVNAVSPFRTIAVPGILE